MPKYDIPIKNLRFYGETTNDGVKTLQARHEPQHLVSAEVKEHIIEYVVKVGEGENAAAMFITDKVAVITGADVGDRTPLIILTATKPAGQNLTGYSYTIASVEPGDAWEPAKVTFHPC